MMLSAASVPARAPGSDSSRVGQDYVVLDSEGKVLRGLNPSAARVWELIDGALSAEQIAGRIADEFEVPAPRALSDVLSFLEVLSSKKLVSL
jgi:pyrroloquinoline quinone biosynthesis protein D